MTKPKKKPTNTIAKKPTKRDAEILDLFQRVAGLDLMLASNAQGYREKFETLLKKTGHLDNGHRLHVAAIEELAERANGVDDVLAANAQTHRGEIAELQKRLDSFTAGQFAQGCSVEALHRKDEESQKQLASLAAGQSHHAYLVSLLQNEVDKTQKELARVVADVAKQQERPSVWERFCRAYKTPRRIR